MKYTKFLLIILLLGVALTQTDPAPAETPAEETPAEETPAEETPAEETPAEETPAEETPAEETPAEETPAEETPAEETPAEEETPEEEAAEEEVVALPENCTEADADNLCTTCAARFFVKEGACVACGANCFECVSDTVCSACEGSTYLNDGVCVADCPKNYSKTATFTCAKCSSDCETCSENDTCDTCNTGFYVNSNSVCKECASDCLSCANGTCTACAEKFTLKSDGSCSANKWWKKWWAWLLIALGALALLGALAYCLSASKASTGYQQWDQTNYNTNGQNNSFRESATFNNSPVKGREILSPSRYKGAPATRTVIGEPIKTIYSDGRVVNNGGNGYELTNQNQRGF